MHTNFEPITKKKKIFKTKAYRQDHKSDVYQRTIGFTCVLCNFPVRSEIEFSGVLNRNHCPFCLWSRHVDLWQAGDRLSACKMPMQPIALTFKKSRNKYGTSRGELMIIHQCQACKAISINRIAADDDVDELLSVMKTVSKLSNDQKQLLESFGINPVRYQDYHAVEKSLYGSIENRLVASW
jgi:hypothetical protein